VKQLLSRLLVSGTLPELKANQNFLKLQDELASTENQILTARTRFNETVRPYNNHIKIFPNSVFAGMFGFKENHTLKLSQVLKHLLKYNFKYNTLQAS
jgi:LemA protein